MLLTTIATVYTLVAHTNRQISDLIAEQTRQLCTSLALAHERAVSNDRADQLSQISKELIKSRNVLYVGFFDAEGRRIALASRDADIDLKGVSAVQASTSQLMQIRRQRSALFGEYVETVAPVLTSAASAGSQLAGYVAVGVSQDGEAAMLRSITYVVVVIAALAVALAIFTGILLVHRILMPIRQLVMATHKIIGGDLDTRVDIERADAIGQLARAFNEMVEWVKQQQRELADANVKLSEANRDLESRIAQRTAQLETANSRLSAEINDKEEFLRAISHDLGAPLRNIDGMATVLLMKYRDKLDADIIHRLQRIKSNVEMGSSMITELLELSRIKTRRQKMERVDLDVLVRDLAGMFDEDLRSRKISLLIETKLPEVECERLRMRQVFQNLIDNAIKYMHDQPDRPREIRIGCIPRLTEAEFYVRDTGIGIHEEELDKVFLVFRRGRNSHAVGAAGKGIGLASVKSIIETYNGRIWVESELGAGSTFRFTINGRYVRSSSVGMTAPGATPGNAEASQTIGDRRAA
ncbi:MAG: ATP-binding protein [Phycisphaerales bacterium]|nr:ATP-binding protein [Phycisphaerales bacterium]